MRTLKRIIKYMDWSHALVMILIIMLVFFAHHFAMEDAYHTNMLEIQSLLREKAMNMNRMLNHIEKQSLELARVAAETQGDGLSGKMETDEAFTGLNVFYVSRKPSDATDTVIQFYDHNQDGAIETRVYDSISTIVANQKVSMQLERVMEGNAPIWSSSFEMNDQFENDRPYVVHATPISDDGLKGMVIVAVPLASFQKEIGTTYLDGYFSLLNENFQVISHPTFRVGTDIGSAFNGQFKDMVASMRLEKEFGNIPYAWIDDRQKRLVYQGVFNGWYVCFSVFEDSLHTGEPMVGLWVAMAVLMVVSVGVTAIYREKQILRLWKELIGNASGILTGGAEVPLEAGGVISPKKYEFLVEQLEVFKGIRKNHMDALVAMTDERNDLVEKIRVLEESYSQSESSRTDCEMQLALQKGESLSQSMNAKERQKQSESLVRCVFRLQRVIEGYGHVVSHEGDFMRTMLIILDIISEEVGKSGIGEERRLHVEDALDTMRVTIEEAASQKHPVPSRAGVGLRLEVGEANWLKDFDDAITPFLDGMNVKSHWMYHEDCAIINEPMLVATMAFVESVMSGVADDRSDVDKASRILVRHEVGENVESLLVQEFSILKGNAQGAFIRRMMRLADAYPSCNFKIEALTGGHAVTITSDLQIVKENYSSGV